MDLKNKIVLYQDVRQELISRKIEILIHKIQNSLIFFIKKVRR